MSDFTDGMKPTVGHVTPDPNPRTIDHAKRTMEFLTSKIPHRAPDEDDQEAALDALPEDPPDKQERWRGVSMTSAAAEVDRAVIEHQERIDRVMLSSAAAIQQAERETYVNALAQAAVNLRDSELLKAQRVREYQEALNAFNKFVAPVEGAK